MKYHTFPQKHASNTRHERARSHGLPTVVFMLEVVMVMMMATTANAIPVKWQEPLGDKPPRRQLLPDVIMAPDRRASDGAAGGANNMCRSGVHLEWAARAGSSVFATPRIVDLSHDGNKEILVPTYTQYLEAIDGVNGEDVAGFPFVHPSFKSYSTPLPVDMDGDGKTEWLVAMYTGELMVFGSDGKARGAIQVPPLPIKKNWAKRNLTGYEAVTFKLKRVRQSEEYLQSILRARRMTDMTPRYRYRGQINSASINQASNASILEEQTPILNERRRHLAEIPAERGRGENGDVNDNNNNEVGDDRWWGGEGKDAADSLDADLEHDVEDLFDDEDDDDMDVGGAGAYRGIGTDGWLSAEARAAMDVLLHPELYRSSVNFEGENDAFNFRNVRNPTTVVLAEDEVAVDPHIMSSPVITDTDGDGDPDIVLHLSYFFDARAYEGERAELLPLDIDINDYVADVLMVVNLVTGEVKWLKVLHLTRRNDTVPAYALSSPVVANPDGGSQQDIYVTTTAGAIFGFSARGERISGWPVWMESPMTSSPSLEDVNADGVLDICAGDTGGNVACFTSSGKQLWSRTFTGAVSEHITYGDVNGDGKIDLTFGTTAGMLYAVQGNDGTILPHFPVTTEGPILASILLVNLNNTKAPPSQGRDGLHLVVPSHDGVLYIVSGTTGCVDGIDMNEKSSTMVLADDITGNGNLDLVVSTLSGSIMVFETSTAFHPLKQWISRVKSTNGFTASEGYVGVFIHPSSRVPRDIRGDEFVVLVTIYDERQGAPVKRQYTLTITIGPRVLVHQKVYKAPGTYAIKVRAPLERMYASLSVVMLLPSGQKYEDSISLSFNMHFLESIKIAFLLPFFLVCLAISFVSKRHEVKPHTYEAEFY